MIKPILPKIEPFNPNVLQPSLLDTASDIKDQELEFEVMKLLSSIPDDHPDKFPYEMVDGIPIAHPCLCYFTRGNNISMGTVEDADQLTATMLGYHKPSNSTAVFMTGQDGMVTAIILYGADGTRRVHGSARHPQV